MLPNLQVMAGAALLIAAASGIGGYKLAALRYQSTIDAMVQETQRAIIARQTVAAQASDELYAKLGKMRSDAAKRSKVVAKIIEKPVYLDCRIDDGGLRALSDVYRN